MPSDSSSLDDPMVGAIGLGQKASVDTSENEAVYDNWAAHYTSSVRAWGYDAPEKATSMLLAALGETGETGDGDLRIIDVGGDKLFQPLWIFISYWVFFFLGLS